MHCRSPPTLSLIVIFALFATSTFAEEVPPEDVCQGSTEGIDHLLYDENGELIFFASAVLQETEDWVEYPCAPKHDYINQIFEEAREPDYKTNPPRLKGCIFTHPSPNQRAEDERILADIVADKVYSKLYVVEVEELLEGHLLSKGRPVITPASFLTTQPIQAGEEKPALPTSFYAIKLGQNVHGIQFCNGLKLMWHRWHEIQKGDTLFILYEDPDDFFPDLDAPIFILRNGTLLGPPVHLDIVNEKQSLSMPTTVNGVVEFIEGSFQ